MMSLSRMLPVVATLALVAAACGGSSDGSSSETEAPVDEVEVTEPAVTEAPVTEAPVTEAPVTEAPVTEAPVTEAPVTEAPVTEAPVTEAPVTEAPVTEAPVTEPDAAPADAVVAEVSLVEWAIEAPTEYAAGAITFTATNDGNFPHEFAVVEGAGYEALPLSEGGSIIEADLPTGTLIGRTGRLGGGSSEDLTVTLAPGSYVLVCNLGAGNNSHAGQGQRLDITVS